MTEPLVEMTDEFPEASPNLPQLRAMLRAQVFASAFSAAAIEHTVPGESHLIGLRAAYHAVEAFDALIDDELLPLLVTIRKAFLS